MPRVRRNHWALFLDAWKEDLIDRESLRHMVDLQVSLILDFFVVCRADIYVVWPCIFTFYILALLVLKMYNFLLIAVEKSVTPSVES